MSLTSAAVDLANALESARDAWGATRPVWKDAVARDFEENHWRPLEDQTLAVLQALDRLVPVLATALRDCS
jgi:hypothetical protein